MTKSTIGKSKAHEENINTWISQIHNDYKLAMSVDCVIFGYTEQDLYVALLQCNMPPYENKLSLVGDLLHKNETLDEAANRILKDRTGLEDVYLEQVKTFSKPDRHPLGRVITTAYYSLLKIDNYKLKISPNCPLVWKKVSEIGDLAFDHNHIFNVCYNMLKTQMKEHPVGFALLPQKFTLNQLQRLYEVIFNVEYDKRNFRRKFKSLNFIKETDEIEQDVSHRPAKLYTFNLDRYKDIDC